MVYLHDYQNDIKSRLLEAWRTHRSVMVQMPTGTGKTHVLAAVVRDFLSADNGSIWIVAHRRELVTQAEETIARYGIEKIDKRVTVLSIQWLSCHWNDETERPSLVIIDEAHHAQAKTYRMLWERCPAARFLGLTATPCRMNHCGFTDLFDVLITSYGIAEFIRQGHLSLFDYVSISEDSVEQRAIDSLEKRGADGDYQIKEMNSVLNRRCSIERLYRSVEQFAGGKKGIVYAVSIDHARSIAGYYDSKGLRSAAIDSRTPVVERRRLVEAFRVGEIRVLVNVDVFSEGFDCPDVEFVQMARPTLSLSKYLQQVGRGLRKSDGKSTCVLIDNVGLYRMFGLPTVDWDWGAMFRGEMSGKGQTDRRKRAGVLSMAGMAVRDVMYGVGQGAADVADGLRVVMSHERLKAEIGGRVPSCAVNVPELHAWHDSDSGLWGLVCGRRRITAAVYSMIFDIRYGMAAVMTDGRSAGRSCGGCGLVDSSGRVVWERGSCWMLRFADDGLLAVTSRSGNVDYVDLRNFQTYNRRPEIIRYGGIELLKVGQMYYSRTKTRYAACRQSGSLKVSRHGFYLAIFDPDVPAPGVRPDGFPYGYQSGYACLLDGDADSYYWMYRRLADDSIIVRDMSDRFYHVSAGKAKKYIGCYDRTSGAGGRECLAAIGRLAGLAEQSVRLYEKTKDMQRLQSMVVRNDAVPFRSGMKWGLKSGGRVVVPPIYRSVRTPVGMYCAVEKNYSQWGIITLDGRTLVEPQYTDVSINDNGTAVLTFVTGKKKAVKL